jgi:hypothetical protein
MSDADRQQRIQELRLSRAPSLQAVEDTTLPDGTTGRGIALRTNRGTIQAIIHEADAPAGGAVMWACGARGGSAGPAEGMYATLAEELTAGNVTSLRLNYRHPADMDESVWDVLIGLELLRSRGCVRVALVGHSFGGAVVIAAAGFSPRSRRSWPSHPKPTAHRALPRYHPGRC